MTTPATHRAVEILDPKTGKKRIVYARTPETSEALEKDRLGKYALMKPLNHQGFLDHIDTKFLVVITTYATANRAIRTRLEKDKSFYKAINGTQLLDAYLKGGEYLEGFTNFQQFFLQFSYADAPNRRLADLVNEIMGLRFHLDQQAWLFIPRPLVELAGQWGDSLLNLAYLPTLTLPPQEGEKNGPLSTAKTDHTPRIQAPITKEDGTQDTVYEGVLKDPKFNKRDRRRR